MDVSELRKDKKFVKSNYEGRVGLDVGCMKWFAMVRCEQRNWWRGIDE